MVNYKLSLHSHTSNFVHFILSKPNKKDYLDKLIKILLKKHGNIVLGVSNFNDDNRYKDLLKATKLLQNTYTMNYYFSDFYFSVSLNGRKIYFVKTDEIETDRGHLLIVGFKGKINKRSLKKVLLQAHNQNCVVIANHPFHEHNLSYFIVKLINSALGIHGEMSITKSEFIKNIESFDALELNAYVPDDWKEIKKFARNNNIPLVSDSDSHFLDEIFTSWYDAKNIDFSDPKSFNKSLKKSFRSGLKLHARRHGYFAAYKHTLQVILEKIGIKLGLLRIDNL